MLLPIPSPAPGVVINNDTSTASVRYPVFAAITNGQAVKEYVSSSKLYYIPSTGVLNATGFAGAGTGLTGTAASLSIGGNAATATLATAATNLAGGVANNMAYQTGAGATAFIAAPSTSGSYLQWTSVGGFAWTPFSGVTSFSAGSTGFTPSVSTTGAITLGGILSAAYGGTGANTLTGYVYGNGTGVMTASSTIPNTAISGLGTISTQNANNVAITGGAINGTTIGASVASTGAFTTLGGTTITASTQFTGPGTGLTGTAASLSIGGTAALATSLASGSTYSIPYQSASGTTAFLAAGASGSILMTLGSFSPPIWTSAAALSVASATNISGGNSGYVPYQSAANTTAFVSAGTTGQVFTSGGTGAPTWTNQSVLSVGTATNIAGGAANQIHYQTGAGATSFITAPTVSSTFLQWNGSAFVWTLGGSGTVTSVAASGGSTGLSFTGSPITTSGTLTLGGTLAVGYGGTGVTTSTGSGSNALSISPTLTTPILAGSTSGGVTLAVPAIAGSNTATFPAATGTVMVSGNMPAFSAYASTAQTLSNSTNTKITFDSKTFDTNNNFSSSRFTPTVAGYYQINACFGYLGGTSYSTTAYFYVGIWKNGANTLNIGSVFSMSAYAQGSTSGLIYLNGSTDYVEIYGAQSSGLSQSCQGWAFNGSLVRAT